MSKRWLIAASLAAGGVLYAGAEPVVLWASDPVRPGEAVQVVGAGLETGMGVTVEGKPAAILNAARGDGFAFVLPSGAPATRPIRCEVGGTPFTLNAPTVWWAQGDRGDAATPGGWIRLFGKSLQSITPGAGGLPGFRCMTQDCWSATFAVPAAARPGERYQSIEIVPDVPDWKTNVFDVTAFGAVPTDRREDTRAILAALAAIRAAGGGILYFPVGRYEVSATVALPPRTCLKGAGMDQTMLVWTDADEPPSPLVALSHHAGILDITLASGHFIRGIATEPRRTDQSWVNVPSREGEPLNEALTLCRVRTRFLHTNVSQAEGIRRAGQLEKIMLPWGFDGVLNLKAKNLRIRDCDFYATKGSAYLWAEDGEIVGNRFRLSDCLYNRGKRYLFEANDCRQTSVSNTNGSRDNYFGNNLFGDYYGNLFGWTDHESFTFDHGNRCYHDTAESDGGCGLKLRISPEPRCWRGSSQSQMGNFHGFGTKGCPAREWIGETVLIAAGRGVGQYRQIAAITGPDTLTLDRPWEIAPDGASIFGIGWSHSRVLIIGNTVADGRSMGVYGSGVDIILSGNRSYRSLGFKSYSAFYYGYPQVNWFVQFLGNEILDGNALFPDDSAIPEDAWIGLETREDYPDAGRPLTIGVVIRNNRLVHSARIGMRGPGGARHVLVEGNRICWNGVGIDLRNPKWEGVTLRANTFQNVAHPYRVGTNVVIDTHDDDAANVASAFDGDEAAPSFQVTNWKVSAGHPLVAGDAANSTSLLGMAEASLSTQLVQNIHGRGRVVSTPANTVVYGRAVVRASREALVRIYFSNYFPNPHIALFLNGRRVGSSGRLYIPPQAVLKAGENVLEFLATPEKGRDDCPCSVTMAILESDPVLIQ